MSRCGRKHPARQRGSILLAAMVVTMMATVLAVGVLYESGLSLSAADRLGDRPLARLCAQAGIEAAARLAPADVNWRLASMDPTILDDQSLGSGTVTVVISDPGDGVLAANGSAGSSTADPVLFAADATVGAAQCHRETSFLPVPHPALRNIVYSATSIDMQAVEIEGRLRANTDVTNLGGAQVWGDITTMSGRTISADLEDLDTDTLYVADSLGMPTVNFSWFVDAGERISLPFDDTIDHSLIDTTHNAYGDESPRAIYWIDANGGNVYFYWNAVTACIAVLNANNVYVGGWSGWAERYYHHSPDPQRLPALVVDGNLHMAIEEDIITVFLFTGSYTLEAGIVGAVYCTGEFWGPQQNAVRPIVFEGAIVAGEAHILGPGTLVRHIPELSWKPLAELCGLELRPAGAAGAAGLGG